MELRARAIERHEKQADRITHETVQLLHKTFITPLDRDEIHQLITGMDDILDLMEDVATCLFLYDVKAVTADAQKLAEICVTCTDKVRRRWRCSESMKNADRDPAHLRRDRPPRERGRLRLPLGARQAVPRGVRRQADHQAEGGLPAARVGHRQVRGRRQRDRRHRARERMTRGREHGRCRSSSRCWWSLVVLALAFDFMNGFHDAANSIATVVSTRVLRPHYAVAWAAFFNFIAFLFFGLSVANTIGKGVVDPGARRPLRDVRRAGRRDRLERRSPGGSACRRRRRTR